jgi:hypothetical protein
MIKAVILPSNPWISAAYPMNENHVAPNLVTLEDTAKELGGTLAAFSEGEGCGATFTLGLPAGKSNL